MPGPLISADELQGDLDSVRLFDLRWSLVDPGHGIAAYEKGHIPGAIFVDLDKDLSAPPGKGRHPLPDLTQFTETLGRLGARRTDDIVVYDDMHGAIAARMWWMLSSIGHPDVRLLDGGLASWTSSGLPLEDGRNRPQPAIYETSQGFAGVVDHRQLQGRTVIDVRAPARYRGEHEPVDPKAGHIPGAVNIPLAENLGKDGRFLSPSALRDIYAGIGPRPVVSCGSGVNACHTAVAYAVAGIEPPEVYIGSFSDWSNRDLPVNTGAEP